MRIWEISLKKYHYVTLIKEGLFILQSCASPEFQQGEKIPFFSFATKEPASSLAIY